MADYSSMSPEELKAELERQRSLVEDVRYERAFLAKQVGMHINASEFARLDRDLERAEEKIATLEGLVGGLTRP